MSNVEGGTSHQSEMLAAIVHDLRHTLFRAGLSAELMQQVDDDEERAMGLDSMVEALGALKRLVQDLDEYSRLQRERLSVCAEDVDSRSVLESTHRSFEPLARARSITISISGGVGLQIAADRERLIQALSNLVHNALVHTPPGGIVVIGARGEGDWVCFSVADMGPGIAPSDLPHIFKGHYRSPQAHYAGRGLGLTIARGLVEQHGGSIWAENRPTGGAVFSFTIPRA